MNRRGIVIPVVMFVMAIMALLSVAALSMASIERQGTQAYLTSTVARYELEGDLNWAYANLDLDSVMPDPGGNIHVGRGVFLHRWSLEPEWSDSLLRWENTVHSYTLEKRNISLWFQGWPTYYIPVRPDTAPGNPDPNAWRCLFKSQCFNSPNFALDTVLMGFTPGSPKYTETP